MYYYCMTRQPLSDRQREEGLRLAERLRKMREATGRSAEDVARGARLSVETVRSIEVQRTPNPGFFTVAHLARELELDLNELAEEAIRRP
jgi:transcriptional regulator with XRE-family HTH domain